MTCNKIIIDSLIKIVFVSGNYAGILLLVFVAYGLEMISDFIKTLPDGES